MRVLFAISSRATCRQRVVDENPPATGPEDSLSLGFAAEELERDVSLRETSASRRNHLK
jgi:hypothetical protein